MLTILAFALIFLPFNKAAADNYDTGWRLRETATSSNTNSYYNSAPYQAPIYVAPAPAVTPVVNSTTVNPNPVMTVNYTPTKTVSTAKTTPKTVTSTTVINPNTGNALAANAVFGSNGFLPSGIIQWILLAMAILIIIILGRTVFGAKDNYHSTPMKHE